MTILELEQQKATQAMEHQVAATKRSHKRYRKPEKGSCKKRVELYKTVKIKLTTTNKRKMTNTLNGIRKRTWKLT